MARGRETRWGGIVDDRLRATGFFHVATLNGVSWLVDPDGGRFLSKGVTTVRFDQDQIRGTDRSPYAEACGRKYGGIDPWRSAAARRLRSFGFNSLGAWSDDQVAAAGDLPLALCPIIDLGAAFVAHQHPGTHAWLHGTFPDVFDPEFEPFCRNRAHEACAARRTEPNIIGWLTDNELRWGPDWRGSEDLLTAFVGRQPESFGRRAALAMLRDRYGSFDDFRAVWNSTARSWKELEHAETITPACRPDGGAAPTGGDASDAIRAAFETDCDGFMGELARRYFEATVAAVKAADPDHLVLGCRFAYVPPPAVLAEAARHLDVVSLNCYDSDPGPAIGAYAATGKPFLIGEFSFRADDSGLPNTHGGGPRVATQRDRARGFEHYVTTALGQPGLVGYHWFEHADQPAEGRFDGENSNYGMVTTADDVYQDLARTMAAVNGRAEDIHAASAWRPARDAEPGV